MLVVTGDGDVLMALGSLATIGAEDQWPALGLARRSRMPDGHRSGTYMQVRMEFERPSMGDLAPPRAGLFLDSPFAAAELSSRHVLASSRTHPPKRK